MSRCRSIPPVFKRFVDFVNDGKPILTGTFKNATGNPFLRIGLVAGSQMGERMREAAARALAHQLCTDIAAGDIGVLHGTLGARGGAMMVSVGKGPWPRFPTWVPNVRSIEEMPLGVLAAAWGYQVAPGYGVLERLCQCKHCGRFFFPKQRRSKFCKAECRWAFSNGRRGLRRAEVPQADSGGD